MRRRNLNRQPGVDGPRGCIFRGVCAFAAVLSGLVACPAVAGTAEIFIHDASKLGRLDVATGGITVVGNLARARGSAVFTDIAFAPDGDLWGITFTDVYQIDPITAGTTHVGSHNVNGANSLTFGEDGRLFAASHSRSNLYEIDLDTGLGIDLGNMGYASSGDMALLDGVLYMTARGSSLDRLVRVDTENPGASQLVGGLPMSEAYGMVPSDEDGLLVLSKGQLFQVNPVTASTSGLLSYAGQGFSSVYGAATYSLASSPEPASALVLMVCGVLVLAGGRGRWTLKAERVRC